MLYTNVDDEFIETNVIIPEYVVDCAVKPLQDTLVSTPVDGFRIKPLPSDTSNLVSSAFIDKTPPERTPVDSCFNSLVVCLSFQDKTPLALVYKI